MQTKSKESKKEGKFERFGTHETQIVILDGKKREYNEPIYTICKHHCPRVHLFKDIVKQRKIEGN